MVVVVVVAVLVLVVGGLANQLPCVYREGGGGTQSIVDLGQLLGVSLPAALGLLQVLHRLGEQLFAQQDDP